ncbi:MAG: hypothetical protein RLY47_368 [Candidatus Parcubacteria bacterium]|jgi:MFS family permease
MDLARLKAFVQRYERQLSVGALVFGFILDSLTLRRVDLLAENIVLVAYLLVAGISIAALDLRHTRMLVHRWFAWMVTVAPIALQFAFGALFSAFVVFYLRSASFSASWPFLIFLVIMLVGNEAFRPYYERLVFHVTVLFLAVLSYSIFLVPTIVGALGTHIFLLSVVVSIAFITIFLALLSIFAPERIREERPTIVRSIALTIILVVLAYAANVIPPIPLSLNDSAVAYGVVRTGDTYQLSVEQPSLAEQFGFIQSYNRAPAEGVSVWTSVFAPIALSMPITHVWQHRENGDWVTMSRISFPISGGRDGGYRGYSTKTNVVPGAWRVSVETPNGQVIGRVRFDITDGAGNASNVSTETR